MRRPMRAPENWAELLAAAIVDLDDELSALPIEPLGAGLDFWAFAVGNERVLRCPRHDVGAVNLEVERQLVPLIAAALPDDLAVPTPLAAAANPLGPGRCLLSRRVPGEIVADDEWRRRGLLDSASAAATIATLIEAIASVPVDLADAAGAPRLGTRQDYLVQRVRVVGEVAALLAQDIAAAVLRAWDRFVDDPANFAAAPAVVHADISLDHLLVGAAADGASRLTGLIDFGDLQIRDPDYELTAIWAAAGADFVGRVQHARGQLLDGPRRAKLTFFELANAVADVLWALDYADAELLDESIALTTELARRMP